jgi:hypothetical protein
LGGTPVGRSLERDFHSKMRAAKRVGNRWGTPVGRGVGRQNPSRAEIGRVSEVASATGNNWDAGAPKFAENISFCSRWGGHVCLACGSDADSCVELPVSDDRWLRCSSAVTTVFRHRPPSKETGYRSADDARKFGLWLPTTRGHTSNKSRA